MHDLYYENIKGQKINTLFSGLVVISRICADIYLIDWQHPLLLYLRYTLITEDRFWCDQQTHTFLPILTQLFFAVKDISVLTILVFICLNPIQGATEY